MRTLFFCLAALFAGLTRPQAQSRPPLNDFRITLDFTSTSGYRNDIDGQEKMRRGLDMALRMWQSVLPNFHYRWVSTEEANFTMRFGSYQTPTSRIGIPCPVDVNWTGCGGLDADWFNDAGGEPFGVEENTFISRTSIYTGYIPATYPPEEYHVFGFGNGYTEGRYRAATPGDMVTLGLHEFAHTLGMQHDNISTNDFLAWYGSLKNSDGTTPSQPYVDVDQNQYPDLPARYYGGGTPASPLVGTLNPLHPIAFYHWAGVSDATNQPKGIPWPPIFAYNSRVFFDVDMKNPSLANAYKFDYPRIKGLISMYRESTREVYLTSDWTDAVNKTGLNKAVQGDAFYVTQVFPKVPAKTKLSVGLRHTLAVREDGTLWAWGDNTQGQLGNGNNTSSNKPVKVGTSTSWVSVAAGDDFSLALKSDGTVWAWGNNLNGVFGNGVAATTNNTPDQVCKTSGPACYGKKYVSIAAGGAHALAIRTDGTLWGWGKNSSGQLGDNSTSNRLYPTQEATYENHWISVSAGASHSLALSSQGTAWTWGSNSLGQLGNDGSSNVHFPQPEITYSNDWDFIVAGRNFCLARKQNGALYSWGDNQYGGLGNGFTGGTLSYPYPVAGEGSWPGWSTLAAGSRHAGGVKAVGYAFTWGYNGFGQLGDNTTSSRNVPGSEVYLGGPEWISMAMGGDQSFAFKADGTLWAWGDNAKGQLGIGSTTTKFLIPTKTLYSALKPTISITSPTDQTQYRNTSTITLKTAASINVSKVEFFAGSTKIGEDLSAPFTYDWKGATRGIYSVTAKATDFMGGTVTSAPVTVWVHTLANWTSTTPAFGFVTNLTTVGTVDWMHTGLNGTETNRKNVTNILTNVTLFNEGSSILHYSGSSSNNLGFTWTDGKSGTGLTPSRTSATYNGIKPSAVTTGEEFQFAVNTPQANRKLDVYLRATNVDVEISATINGVLTSTANWTSANGVRIYSLVFGSALPPPVYTIIEVKAKTVRSGATLQLMGASVTTSP